MKKIILACTLVVVLLLQSASAFTIYAETESTNDQSTTYLYQNLPEDLKLLQEKLKIEQEQLRKDQEQLKSDQEKLKADQEKLRKEQLQLKNDQQKLADHEKFKKLNTEITVNNYINYIKNLGYYKNIFKNDEKLNIRNALLLFQSNHNMNASGKWDETTKAMLINRLLSSKFTYLDTIKEAPVKGKWIVINKTKRTLTLYEGVKVIKKYAVAVGNPATLTTTGKYLINSKIINPYWGGGGFSEPIKGGLPTNPLGSRWLGINRKDGSYGIHGTNSPYSIGTYASHGCIRMQNYCVEELFPLVSVNSPVWIGTEAELNKWGITQKPYVQS